MIRRLGLVLAVAAGLCAALLLGTGVDVQHDGQSVSCGSVINAAAVTDVRGNREVDLACHDAHVRMTALAGLAALACVAAGTVASYAGRRPPPGYVTSSTTSTATAGR